MPDFPIDVVVDILLRLPVISLLRFRCVSKLFCALIDSRDVVKSHLKRSIETKNHRSLVFETENQERFCSINFDSLDTAVEVDYPLKPTDLCRTQIFGSCHGLVGLCNGRDLAIWNPSTRRCQNLPYTAYTGRTECSLLEMYGFGYDSVNDDYKVVKIVRFHHSFPQDDGNQSFGCSVKVYSMKSNSWKMIPDYPHFIIPVPCFGVLVGSSLHWVVIRDLSFTDMFITAIDLTAEDYRLVPQPEFSDNNFDMSIAELGGSLCVLCCYKEVRDVWVMKDYGVKESWTKLFSVAQPEVIENFYKFVIPLAYSKSGFEVLFVEDNQKLGWYDLKQKNIKKIKTCGIPDYF